MPNSKKQNKTKKKRGQTTKKPQWEWEMVEWWLIEREKSEIIDAGVENEKYSIEWKRK